MTLRDRYLAWREAVARRSAAGELRATAAERQALEAFTTLLEVSTPEEREAWEGERLRIDEAERRECACGHPIAHHDGSGSCFHVVGCSTGCDCTRM